MQRRNFLKNSGIAAASFAFTPATRLFAGVADTKVKIGIIGVGLRGQNHLELLLRRKDVEVAAICDISDRMLASAKEIVSKSGKKMPEIFTGDVFAWKQMLEKTQLDGVVIATPWEWHKPMIIGSLEAGVKYVGSEVMIGITLEDHWDVVKATEQHKAQVMMLENVCYRRDVVTTNIRCANGETVLLQHDTNLPRPYSLGFRVQGTEGLWMDLNKGIYIQDKSAKPHQWDTAKEWLDKYDHPLWKRWSKDTEGAGHGGMDFFVIHAFIESVKRKTETPMNVYDAATWSAITPLSERSIALGNQTVEFPDFTGGKWMFEKPVFSLEDAY